MYAKFWHHRSPAMIERKRIAQGKHRSFALVAALLLAATVVLVPRVAGADDTVTLSLTLKDHKFDPAELHAPAGKPFDIRVKNLGDIAFEFESSTLHFEKIVPPGGEAVVHVRPQQPGRYSFVDDFHHETQGVLIVP
jgi:heme/copper-type cytochrome/quinol oxidase subunit 2